MFYKRENKFPAFYVIQLYKKHSTTTFNKLNI